MKTIAPLVLAATALLATGCIVPQGSEVGVFTELAVATQHNHRGMTQNAKPVLQPVLSLSLPVDDQSSLIVDFDGTMNLTSDTGDAWFPNGHGGEFSEVELGAGYVTTIDGFDIAAGISSYNLPNGTEFPFGERGGSHELFASISGEFVGFTPAFFFHWDFDEAEGYYAKGEISRIFLLNDDLELRVATSLGYSDDGHALWAYGLEEAGLADARGTAALTWFMDDNTTVELEASASTIVDDDQDTWFDQIGIDPTPAWISLGIGWGI